MRDVVMYLPFVVVTALTLIAAAIGIAVADASAPMTLSGRTLLACGIGGFYLANAAAGIRLEPDDQPVAAASSVRHRNGDEILRRAWRRSRSGAPHG